MNILFLWSPYRRGKTFYGFLLFFCVSHIHKQGNSIAHDFARHVSGLMVWMEDVPPHNNFVLLADFD